MKKVYEVAVAIALQAVLSFIISLLGFWYLQFIFAAVIGLFLNFGLLTSASIGLGGVIGTLFSLFSSNVLSAFAYASLAGQIMGLGGYLPLLFMLLLLAFITSWAGGMVGSAFTLHKNTEMGSVKQSP